MSSNSTSISALVVEIAARNNLRKSGGRFAGPCPECGGSAKSDKFSFYLDGGFRCFSCEFKGDIITWLRKKEGMSCPEAHEHAGVDCRAASCQVRGKCRLGDGSGKTSPARVKTITPMSSTPAAVLPLTIIKTPAALWREWAESITDKAVGALQRNDHVLAWLAKRGITREAADTFGLGYLEHDRRVNRQSIGLSPRNGKDDLWIPGGLLIAIYDDERIHRLRVRRTNQARDKFLPDLKYVWLEGSGNEPMVLRPAGKIRGAVIVEAELDAIAIAAAHDQVLVIAIGSVSSGLPEKLRTELTGLPVILVALDADQGKNGQEGAGQAACKRWFASFRRAKFWPVPSGKDPGNYAELGGNLRGWIEAGLIPEPPASAPSHEAVFIPVSLTPGEGGVEKKSVEKKAAPEQVPVVPGLKWCPMCFGTRFLAADGGGYFCLTCQPMDLPGLVVLGVVARAEYVVD